jgi:hypothetical protein
MPLKYCRCGLAACLVCALVAQEVLTAAAHPTSHVKLYIDVDMPHTPHKDRAPPPPQTIVIQASASAILPPGGANGIPPLIVVHPSA